VNRPDGAGVKGEGRTGVFGEGDAGVRGKGNAFRGVGVQGQGAVGVFGTIDPGIISPDPTFAFPEPEPGDLGNYAVVGDTRGRGEAGILGRGNIGVLGTSSREESAAVIGRHTGTKGHGVQGEGQFGLFGQGKFVGVQGNADSIGVRGEGNVGVVGQGKNVGVTGTFTGSGGPPGPGVRGVGDYGGQFQGRSAQLHLRPVTSVGRPTTGQHNNSEIFLDQEGTLFVCVAVALQARGDG
jgi:hypothetical protein